MQDSIMEALWRTSHISGGNAAYVEELYDTYLHDPNAVDEQWRTYFEQLPRVQGVFDADTPHSIIRQQFAELAKERARSHAPLGSGSINVEIGRASCRERVCMFV